MVTLPHKSRKRAYRNILRTTISTLWRMQLLRVNHAPLHLPHANCRKASYIHIARDDLQRRDLFKPAQYLRSVIFSNLHNNFALTLTNYPYSAFEPKPPPTSHLTFTLPMTTHTSPTTSAQPPLASPSRSWVTNSTPSYTVPTLPPSPTLPSSALPAPHPPTHHNPCWDMEMSLVYPSCPLIPGYTATPPLPLSESHP